MDQIKVDFFKAQYGTLDKDGLEEVHGRRASLADEAAFALDAVLNDKGLQATFAAPITKAPSDSAKIDNEKQAKELWKGVLVMACKLAFAVTLWAPVNYALNKKNIHLGAIWVGLLAVALGYAGFRIGHMTTRGICSNETTTYSQKRKSLWLLLGGTIFLYFILFMIAGSI